MNSDLERISTNVEELTCPRTHAQPRTVRDRHGTWVTTNHLTHVPALLDQLRTAIEPSSSTGNGRNIPSSRPTIRIDALDTLTAIEQSTYWWCKTYAEHRRWDDLSSRLHALVGAATFMEPDSRHALAVDSSRWTTWARFTTGWETPAFRPDNTCPLCAARDTLRIRVGDGISSYDASALCTNCREVWDSSNIGLLADHIRSENGEIEAAV